MLQNLWVIVIISPWGFCLFIWLVLSFCFRVWHCDWVLSHIWAHLILRIRLWRRYYWRLRKVVAGLPKVSQKGGFWSLCLLSLRQESWGPACSGVAWPSGKASSCSSCWPATPVPPSPAQAPRGRIAEAAFLQKWKLSLWPFTFQLWLGMKGLSGSHLWRIWGRARRSPTSVSPAVWFPEASVTEV